MLICWVCAVALLESFRSKHDYTYWAIQAQQDVIFSCWLRVGLVSLLQDKMRPATFKVPSTKQRSSTYLTSSWAWLWRSTLDARRMQGGVTMSRPGTGWRFGPQLMFMGITFLGPPLPEDVSKWRKTLPVL